MINFALRWPYAVGETLKSKNLELTIEPNAVVKKKKEKKKKKKRALLFCKDWTSLGELSTRAYPADEDLDVVRFVPL